MDALLEFLNFLSWPTKVINFLRAQLAEINVPLSAFAAQLLAAILFLAVAWYFLSKAREKERSLRRLGARSVVVACVMATVCILSVWLDNLIVKRSSQIIGKVVAEEFDGMRVDLLDQKGNTLGPQVEMDNYGNFVITYAPVFADPPSSLSVTVAGCSEKQVPIRRPHLLGNAISVQMECGSSNE